MQGACLMDGGPPGGHTARMYQVPDRRFRVVRFLPTHNQLLLYSDPAPEAGHLLRLEVLFVDVAFLCLPPVFDGLSLRRADAAERRGILATTGGAEKEVYLLGPDTRWFVVAGVAQWLEADRSYSDPSVFFPEGWEMDPDVAIGRIV